MCGSDIVNDLDARPVARQMRHSLLEYMASEAFDPTITLTREQLASLLREPTTFQRLNATATADSEQPGHEAQNVLDNDDGTIWHTAWGDETPDYPHWIVIDMKQPTTLRGVALVPRQDMTNGRVGSYRIFASNDGENWGDAVASGNLGQGAGPQDILFEKPITTRYLKFLARRAAHRGHPWAALAEVRPILPKE